MDAHQQTNLMEPIVLASGQIATKVHLVWLNLQMGIPQHALAEIRRLKKLAEQLAAAATAAEGTLADSMISESRPAGGSFQECKPDENPQPRKEGPETENP